MTEKADFWYVISVWFINSDYGDDVLDGLCYSPFVDTRYSLKGKKETPEQYISGGCLFINPFLIFHQSHMSRVFSSDSKKQSYDPCFFCYMVYSLDILSIL